MSRLVLLLRGINLAGRRRVAMADLRALLEAMGHEEVRTHLQSGNVVLASAGPPERVARDVGAAIGERLGLDVHVLARTGEELAAVVAADPLGDVATDPSRSHVLFLSAEPDPETARALAAADLAPERIAVVGREA